MRGGTLVAAMALTWLGAFLLAGRQRGLGVLLSASFGAQYGMHHLFTLGAAHASPSPWTGEHGTGLGMLLIHAALAVLSAWVLEHGESALALIVHLAVTPVRGLRAVLRVLAGALVGIAAPSPRPVVEPLLRVLVVPTSSWWSLGAVRLWPSPFSDTGCRLPLAASARHAVRPFSPP